MLDQSWMSKVCNSIILIGIFYYIKKKSKFMLSKLCKPVYCILYTHGHVKLLN